jgi:hypothetical protein
VSINLTLKQGLFLLPLKFIGERFDFCLKQSALETPRDHEERHEVDEVIEPEFAPIQHFLDDETRLRCSPIRTQISSLVYDWPVLLLGLSDATHMGICCK